MGSSLLAIFVLIFFARLVHSTDKPFPLLVAKGDNKTNPLLLDWDIPPYDLIRPEHLVPATKHVMENMERELRELEKNAEPEWSKLVRPLEKINDRIEVFGWMLTIYSELLRDEFGAASDEADIYVQDLLSKMRQSVPIYNAFKAIRDSPSWETMSEARQRVVEGRLRFRKESALAKKDQERLKTIETEIGHLEKQYVENMGVRERKKSYGNLKSIAIVPNTRTAMLARLNITRGDENNTIEKKICATEEKLPYFYILEQACDSSLRKEAYLDEIQTGTSKEHNNTAVIERILELRLEKAQLFGFKSFAEMQIGNGLDTIKTMLERYRKFKLDQTTREMEDLKSFVRDINETAADNLNHWDVPYWKWIKDATNPNFTTQGEHLLYFSLENVLKSIHDVVKKVFDVTIEPADGLAPVWHKDVRFYALKDSSSNPLGYLYLDPYSRSHKVKCHAFEITSRGVRLSWNGASTRLPIFCMACNLRPPSDGIPSLLTFHQIQAMFHEHGHALQGLLTKQDESFVTGWRGIERGEFIGMFMMYWPYQRHIIKSIAKHYKTGEALSDELLDKYIVATRESHFETMLYWIDLSSIDFELHLFWKPNGTESIFDISQRVLRETDVLPPLPENKIICSRMRSCFAGGYPSTFHDYLAADLTGADAFQEFVNAGLHDEKALKEVGLRFRNTFLAEGGGKSLDNLFIDFRGRKVSYEDYESIFRLKGMRPAKK